MKLLTLICLLTTIQTCLFGSTTIHLNQQDFDSGTYRIKTGGTYILDEDIKFDPIPLLERPDKPGSGWFAAITVETSDGVIIDLNHKKLEESQHFLDTNTFTVFSNIELDNSPFCGMFYGTLGTVFNGDTEYVAANNVTIKNGTLGRSSHWGIHGNNNKNIHAENLCIKDFEVSGIETNSLINASFKKIDISGLEHVINIPPVMVIADVVMQVLKEYSQDPAPVGPQARSYLANLEAYVASNPKFSTPLYTVPGSMYAGIIMASGFTTLSPFPMTASDCEYSAEVLSNGNTVSNVEFEDIKIRNLLHNPVDVAYIGSTMPTPTPLGPLMGNMIGLNLIGFLGSMEWNDAFDQNGNFAPNPLLQGMCFGALQLIDTTPILATFLPPNFADIANSILNSDESKFLANVQPMFGRDILSHTMKGTFGMRIDCCESIKIKNCTMDNIRNIGTPGVELTNIPDGEYFVNSLTQPRYAGADIWGIEIAVADGIKIENVHASNISSQNGDVFGLDLINEVGNAHVKKCSFDEIMGFGDNTTSHVNTPSEVYGMRVQNNIAPICIKECSAGTLISCRAVFGFASEESDTVTFDHCHVKKIAATSSKDLVKSPKEAFAFSLEGGVNTAILHPHAKGISIKGESYDTTSLSRAAGIFIDEESDNTLITHPKISCVCGGEGEAYKILNLGENTRVK